MVCSEDALGGRSPGTQCRRIGHFWLNGKLKLDEVDGSLCTHLLLASWRINSRANIVPLEREDEEQRQDHLAGLAQFKQRYPHLKVLLSVVNEPDEGGLARAASSAEFRHKLARSAMELLGRHHLDGLSLDLDLHASTAVQQLIMGNRIDSSLCKILIALREAIVENFYARQLQQQQQQQQQSQQTNAGYSAVASANNNNANIEPYLLTFSLAGQEPALGSRISGCELKQVAKLCDWIQIKSYDYFLFRAYAPFTGPIAPLYPIVDHYVPILGRSSLSCTLTRLLDDYEIPRDKLVLSIAAYGRAYRLAFRSSQPSAFSLAIGTKPSSRDCQRDILSFSEICDILKRPGTIEVFDERARVPYLLTDDGYTWISCESEQSVREKVRYIVDNQLAGYIGFNLNLDADQNFPLHRAMMDETLASQKSNPLDSVSP